MTHCQKSSQRPLRVAEGTQQAGTEAHTVYTGQTAALPKAPGIFHRDHPTGGTQPSSSSMKQNQTTGLPSQHVVGHPPGDPGKCHQLLVDYTAQIPFVSNRGDKIGPAFCTQAYNHFKNLLFTSEMYIPSWHKQQTQIPSHTTHSQCLRSAVGACAGEGFKNKKCWNNQSPCGDNTGPANDSSECRQETFAVTWIQKLYSCASKVVCLSFRADLLPTNSLH